MAADRGRRSAVLAAAAALAGSAATGASADTIEEIAARSNAQAAKDAAAKAQAKADAQAADGLVNAASSVALLGLGGFAAYTAVSYLGDSNTRYSNLDDQGNERGYQALAKGEALIQVDPNPTPLKKSPKSLIVKKAPPPKKPAFELPNFGEFGAKAQPKKAAPKKAAPKAKASPKAAPPAFKFPWD